MDFYKIDQRMVNFAMGLDVDLIKDFEEEPSQEIKSLVETMQKYVIPPKFDFITNPTVDPSIMYIFEFKHTFTKQDLSDMWQNLPPDSLLSVKEPKESQVSISHALLPQSFFGPSFNPANANELLLKHNIHTTIKPETQWLVFKVKQKAEKNYFKKTADSADDTRFKFQFNYGSAGASEEEVPDYSYNWPYDYFSMVELASIDAGVTFEGKGE
jgi:hypothetical protein